MDYYLLGEELESRGYCLDSLEGDVSGGLNFWGNRKRNKEKLFIKAFDGMEDENAAERYFRELDVYKRLFNSEDRGDEFIFSGPKGGEDEGRFARPYRSFRVDNLAWVLVSKFYEGDTLAERIWGYGGIGNLDTKVNDMLSILHAFRRLHSSGIAYIDVKPENFIVNAAGTEGMFSGIRAVDFDYCRYAGEPVGETIFVTQGYISKDFRPEHGIRRYDAAFDISSLGFLFLDMMHGFDPLMHERVGFMVGEREVTTAMSVSDAEARRRFPYICRGRSCVADDGREARLLDEWFENFRDAVPGRHEQEKAERVQRTVKRMLEGDRGRRYSQVDDVIGELAPLVA